MILYNNRNKKNSKHEKVEWIISILAIVSIFIIYIFDKENIPTKYGWLNNIDSNRWFDFISNYFITIFGVFLSSYFAICVALNQINYQKKSNNDDKRIQNAPLLKYCFYTDKLDNCFTKYMNNNKNNDLLNYSIFFKVENLGLNHAKKVSCEVSISEENYKKFFRLNDEQSILKMNSYFNIELVFNFEETSQSNKKKINFNFEYSDVLNNKYSQKVMICVYVTNTCSSHIWKNDVNIEEIIVDDEILVNSEE